MAASTAPSDSFGVVSLPRNQVVNISEFSTFTIDNVVQEAFLKLWNYRETITSEEHAVRFLKQNVKWECHAYFRNPVSRFHRRFTYLHAIEDYDTVFALLEPENREVQDEVTEDQLKAISDIMPFLTSGRQKNLLRLYYKDGLSHKQIAVRYGTSVSAITLELQKALDSLKAMIVQPQRLFGEPHLSPAGDISQRIWLYDIEGLSKEQSQVYRLRSELKYDFPKIASYLGQPLGYVQKEYVRAWKIVQQNNKSGLGRMHTSSGHQKQPVTTFLIA